jgi:hypothetical protein
MRDIVSIMYHHVSDHNIPVGEYIFWDWEDDKFS